ncbi:hypothetical protein JCM3766R1_001415 [Sporobolomyces carnicolor]
MSQAEASNTEKVLREARQRVNDEINIAGKSLHDFVEQAGSEPKKCPYNPYSPLITAARDYGVLEAQKANFSTIEGLNEAIKSTTDKLGLAEKTHDAHVERYHETGKPVAELAEIAGFAAEYCVCETEREWYRSQLRWLQPEGRFDAVQRGEERAEGLFK